MNTIEDLISQSKPDAKGRSRGMAPKGSGIDMWISPPHNGRSSLHIDGPHHTATIPMNAPELIALGAALIAHGRALLP